MACYEDPPKGLYHRSPEPATDPCLYPTSIDQIFITTGPSNPTKQPFSWHVTKNLGGCLLITNIAMHRPVAKEWPLVIFNRLYTIVVENGPEG